MESVPMILMIGSHLKIFLQRNSLYFLHPKNQTRNLRSQCRLKPRMSLRREWFMLQPISPFPPLPGGSKLLYMYNLSPSIQESDIVEFFKNDEEIDWITLQCMMREDRLGYAYVRFHTSEAAQKALKRKVIGHAVKLLESEERTIFDMFTPSDEHKYLFMGNLSLSVTKKDITNFFVDAGKVVSVNIITAGGHFKGYAHVKFASSTVAHKAIRRYGQMLHGRYVELELATEKTIWYTYTPSSGYGILQII